MVRIHKTVEYALIALKHLRDSPKGAIVSAKELSERYKLPYELVSKVLQRLTAGLVLESQQGVRGGYRLGAAAEHLTLLNLSRLLPGTFQAAKCGSAELRGGTELEERHECSAFSTCTIVAPITNLGRKIESLLSSIRVFDLLEDDQDAGNMTRLAPTPESRPGSAATL